LKDEVICGLLDLVIDSELIYAIEKANAVADAINAVEPGRALAVVGDILDASYVETLVKRTAEFGGGKIHIIVNNAGFTWDGVIHKVSFWENIVHTIHPCVVPRDLGTPSTIIGGIL
jgi:NAD(P)-dependent dehydrogenase (short-subunit alcohol dehydrogenase family)